MLCVAGIAVLALLLPRFLAYDARAAVTTLPPPPTARRPPRRDPR